MKKDKFIDLIFFELCYIKYGHIYAKLWLQINIKVID